MKCKSVGVRGVDCCMEWLAACSCRSSDSLCRPSSLGGESALDGMSERLACECLRDSAALLAALAETTEAAAASTAAVTAAQAAMLLRSAALDR